MRWNVIETRRFVWLTHRAQIQIKKTNLIRKYNKKTKRSKNEQTKTLIKSKTQKKKKRKEKKLSWTQITQEAQSITWVTVSLSAVMLYTNWRDDCPYTCLFHKKRWTGRNWDDSKNTFFIFDLEPSHYSLFFICVSLFSCVFFLLISF